MSLPVFKNTHWDPIQWLKMPVCVFVCASAWRRCSKASQRLLLASRVAIETSGVREERHLWGVCLSGQGFPVLSKTHCLLETNTNGHRGAWFAFANTGKHECGANLKAEICFSAARAQSCSGHISQRGSGDSFHFYASGKLTFWGSI